MLLHEAGLGGDHVDDRLDVGFAMRSEFHVRANRRRLQPNFWSPVQSAGEKLHPLGYAGDDLRHKEVVQLTEGNVEGEPLAVELVIHHRHHLRSNHLLAEGFVAEGECLEGGCAARGNVSLANVLQDGSFSVDLPQELQSPRARWQSHTGRRSPAWQACQGAER